MQVFTSEDKLKEKFKIFLEVLNNKENHPYRYTLYDASDKKKESDTKKEHSFIGGTEKVVTLEQFKKSDGKSRGYVAVKRINLPQESKDKTIADIEEIVQNQTSFKNVCKLSSPVIQGNYMYLIMEYINGERVLDILEWIENGTRDLCEKDILDLFKQMCNGLMELHLIKSAHLDLSPDNMMIDAETKRLVLIDHCDGGIKKGTSSVLRGTDGYKAPEQIWFYERENGIQIRSVDIFTMGISLYQFLKKNMDLSRCIGNALIHLRDIKAFKKMDKILNSLPKEDLPNQPLLSRIARKCLQFNPQDRYQSARDVLFDLQIASDEKAKKELLSLESLLNDPKLKLEQTMELCDKVDSLYTTLAKILSDENARILSKENAELKQEQKAEEIKKHLNNSPLLDNIRKGLYSLNMVNEIEARELLMKYMPMFGGDENKITDEEYDRINHGVEPRLRRLVKTIGDKYGRCQEICIPPIIAYLAVDSKADEQGKVESETRVEYYHPEPLGKEILDKIEASTKGKSSHYAKYHFGICKLMQGRDKEALTPLKEAVEELEKKIRDGSIKKEDVESYKLPYVCNLAIAHLGKGNGTLDEAKRLCSGVNSLESHATLAVIHYQQSNYKAAIKECKTALGITNITEKELEKATTTEQKSDGATKTGKGLDKSANTEKEADRAANTRAHALILNTLGLILEKQNKTIQTKEDADKNPEQILCFRRAYELGNTDAVMHMLRNHCYNF